MLLKTQGMSIGHFVPTTDLSASGLTDKGIILLLAKGEGYRPSLPSPLSAH